MKSEFIKKAGEDVLGINEDFRMDPQKFLGEFYNTVKGYTVEKRYVQGRGHQMQLYSTRVSPDLGPGEQYKGSVCLVHGFAEHSGRYHHVMESLAMKGYQVHALDLRGFGYSGGSRGSCKVEHMHQDVHTLLEQADPTLPLFLMGFSMGGMLVASFILNNTLNLSGAILVNPLVEVPSVPTMPQSKQLFVKAQAENLKDIVANSMINPTCLTKNHAHYYSIFKDTMNLPYCGLNFAKYLLECTEYIQDNASRFQVPLLMLLGQQDGLLDYTKAQQFYDQVTFVDKQIRLFPQGYHEMHNDKELPEVMDTIKHFIGTRVQNNNPVGPVASHLKYGYSLRPLKIKRRVLLWVVVVLVVLRLIRQIKSKQWQWSVE